MPFSPEFTIMWKNDSSFHSHKCFHIEKADKNGSSTKSHQTQNHLPAQCLRTFRRQRFQSMSHKMKLKLTYFQNLNDKGRMA